VDSKLKREMDKWITEFSQAIVSALAGTWLSERDIDELKTNLAKEVVSNLTRTWNTQPPARLADVIDEHISTVFVKCDENISATARYLGVNRRTLERRKLGREKKTRAKRAST
jgi:ActR/RegA family two-component response regulator